MNNNNPNGLAQLSNNVSIKFKIWIILSANNFFEPRSPIKSLFYSIYVSRTLYTYEIYPTWVNIW